jgi:hypothetical protein
MYATETYSAVDQAKLDLTGKGNVRLPEQSISRTAWANVTIKEKPKTMLETIGNIFNPKATVIFKGQPKYITDHTIIAGKPFTMSVTGNSVKDAEDEIKKKAAQELEGINHFLRTTNLLYSG